jgi:hypothetical protein
MEMKSDEEVQISSANMDHVNAIFSRARGGTVTGERKK